MADALIEVFSRNLRRWLSLEGKTQAELARYMKVSSATASDWCNGRKMPRSDKLQSICNWFNISLVDLLEEYSAGESIPDFSQDELDLINDYRELTQEGKERIREQMDLMMSKYRKKEAVTSAG